MLNPPADMPRILPHLIYEDVGVAVEWLCRVFGFSERAWVRHTDAGGRVTRTQLQVLDSVLTVGAPGAHDLASPSRGVSSMLYVYVDDVDAHYARAVSSGAAIVMPLGTRDFGDRNYQTRDPEGHQWIFGQHVADVDLHDHISA